MWSLVVEEAHFHHAYCIIYPEANNYTVYFVQWTSANYVANIVLTIHRPTLNTQCYTRFISKIDLLIPAINSIIISAFIVHILITPVYYYCICMHIMNVLRAKHTHDTHTHTRMYTLIPNKLTPWNRILFNRSAAQLLQKFPVFQKNLKFIVVNVHHWTLT